MVKYVKIRLEDKIHLEFRKMCLEAGTNMQQRLSDLIVRDIQSTKAKQKNSRNESHRETNGHNYPKIIVTKPRKEHREYKNKVGELVSELDEKVKVLIDGFLENFYDDEIEVIDDE
jgi:uncharacterized FlaG/YvyC family protein